MTSDQARGKLRDLLKRAENPNDSTIADDSCVTGATRVFSSVAEAEKNFVRFREKLLHVARWKDCSDISDFDLFDESGVLRPAKTAAVGDYIKITLPGSGKADWVKIGGIDESADETVLVVRPANDPTGAGNEETTSHFFTEDSTNNFCLQRSDAAINFYVVGLNERINTKETGGVLETVRNYATAHLGHILGIQKTQWETFCRNFLETNENEK